jgi:hypothetical protein
MTGYWTMTAAGAIDRVERENLDKSGRNPRYMVTYFLRPERTGGVPDGVTLPDELPLRAKSAELEKMTGSPDPFAAGDRIEVSARGSDPTPTSFYLLAARKL